jgi:hypothetical protein
MYANHTTREDVFSLLSNQRRRYAVRACQQLETPIELGELAEYVAAEECNKSIMEITGEERRRVYTSLQQIHIDKLEEANVIECERKTITPTERLEELEFYLEVVPGNEIPWAQYYLGLSGVTGVVVAAAWLGVYPDVASGLGWALGVVAVFAVSAAVHYYETRRHRLGLTQGETDDE